MDPEKLKAAQAAIGRYRAMGEDTLADELEGLIAQQQSGLVQEQQQEQMQANVEAEPKAQEAPAAAPQAPLPPMSLGPTRGPAPGNAPGVVAPPAMDVLDPGAANNLGQVAGPPPAPAAPTDPGALMNQLGHVPAPGERNLPDMAMKLALAPDNEPLNEWPEDIESQRKALLDLEEQDRQKGVDAVAYPHSFTHKVQYYAPPVAEVTHRAEGGEGFPTWVHFEETPDAWHAQLRAIAEYEPGPDDPPDGVKRVLAIQDRAQSLLDSGDLTSEFNDFRDLVWMRTHRAAQEEGQKAVRAQFVPDSEKNDQEAVAARRMVRTRPLGVPMPGMGAVVSALDSTTFGNFSPVLAWYNSDMEDSPLGVRLRREGIYHGELHEYERVKGSADGAEGFASSAAGLMLGGLTAGGAYRAADKIATRGLTKAAAQYPGRELGKRMLKHMLLGGAVDAAGAVPRSALEQYLSQGEVKAGQIALDAGFSGVTGAIGGIAGGVVGEAGSRLAGAARARNTEIKHIEEALDDSNLTIGSTGSPRLYGEASTPDDIMGHAGRHRSAGGRAGYPDDAQLGAEELARKIGARNVAKPLGARAEESLKRITGREETYFNTPHAQEEKVLDAEFGALRELLGDQAATNAPLRRDAADALAGLGNFRVSTDPSAARAQGGLVIRMDDALVQELGYGPASTNAKRAFRKKWLASSPSQAAVSPSPILGPGGQPAAPGSPAIPGKKMPGDDRLWLTLTPAAKSARDVHKVLEWADGKIRYGSKSGEGATPGIKKLAATLRSARARWQGFDEMVEANHVDISKMEGVSRMMGKNFTEMTGERIPQALRDTIHDASLNTVEKMLGQVYESGYSAESNQLVAMLGNKRLTRVLKAIRGVTAQGRSLGGGNAHVAASPGSDGGVSARVVQNMSLWNKLYGAGRAVELAYKAGGMSATERLLLEPRVADFLRNADDGQLAELLNLSDKKESEEQSE